MKTSFLVTVEGQGSFPVDMLRYDACYPASESDSARLDGRELRTVTLRMPNKPTVGRWASFNWRIAKVVKS